MTSNNELSNAFSVRGGSYDENQFFIDGFEIYRPLRISQGEQEGLGLINGDLTDRLTLFAGGFPVRYGGKLASVLDASYARPEGAFAGTLYGSTLDAGGRVSGLIGRGVGLAIAARSARPQRFFAGQELEGTYDPDFRDVQGVLDARLSSRHALRIDGLVARHRFRLAPQQRETTFGIFPNLVRTVAIDYQGEELDGYTIGFGGALLQEPTRAGRGRAPRVRVHDRRVRDARRHEPHQPLPPADAPRGLAGRPRPPPRGHDAAGRPRRQPRPPDRRDAAGALPQRRDVTASSSAGRPAASSLRTTSTSRPSSAAATRSACRTRSRPAASPTTRR